MKTVGPRSEYDIDRCGSSYGGVRSSYSNHAPTPELPPALTQEQAALLERLKALEPEKIKSALDVVETLQSNGIDKIRVDE